MDTKKVDWAKIRAEFVTNGKSAAQLSEQYAVSKSAIQKRSAKGKWMEARRKLENDKEERIAERLHNEDVKQTIRDIEHCCSTARKMIEHIDKALRQVDKVTYVKYDDKTVSTERNENDGTGEASVRMVTSRKMKLGKMTGTVDTKKLSELSKSLLNVCQILNFGEDEPENAGGGVIEIPQMITPVPPRNAGDDDA